MCGHCMGCSQCPKIECRRLAKIDKNLTTPKGVSTPWIFLLQLIRGDPTMHGLLHKFEHTYIVGSHAYHLRCMHSTKHGPNNKPHPLVNQRTTKLGFLYHKVVHLLEMLSARPFCSISNGHTCQLCTPTLTPPYPNLNPFKTYLGCWEVWFIPSFAPP
jgi:hypothetical protein